MPASSTKFGVSREVLTQNQGRIRPLQASAIPRIQFSTGSAKALRDFSFDMFNVSSRMEDQLDEQATAEATVEGALAGATGNFETVDYNTIRGRAFNQAGIQAFVSTLETRSIAQMSALQTQFANDPEGLRNAIDLYTQGVAEEIDKVSPGAGVQYRQRQTVRGLPAVEAARDNAYRLTKDQAEASLIQSQIALNAEVKTHATDLFSDNPARSQAAANAIGIVREEIFRVYNAVDPVTGRPLYTEVERATAVQKFNDDVMSSATLSWFDQHEDKTAAYLEFTSGDFSINFDTSPAKVDIRDATGGKIRDLPITETVQNQLSTAVTATDPSLGVMLVSGGQVDAATARNDAIEKLEAAGVEPTEEAIAVEVEKVRTGSERHDHGEAGDIVLTRNGEPVTPLEDPELYARFLQNAAASGFTGIGHYDWGVHVGGGDQPMMWGPDTKRASVDPVFGEAIRMGWANPIDTQGGVESVSVSDTMSDKAINAIDSEMRSQISFANTQADRLDREEQAEIVANQATSAFLLSTQLYAGGTTDENGIAIPNLTRTNVIEAVARQHITAAKGEALIKALTVEAPKTSDRTVLDDLRRRLYIDEEDIGELILSNSSSLSASDASSLLSKNQSLQNDEQTMTESQRGYMTMLKNTIAPEGIFAKLDSGATQRAFNAIDEYRKRIFEGEPEDAVARDLMERTRQDNISFSFMELQTLQRPRFSVPVPGKGIDFNSTLDAIDAAFSSNKMSEASYYRQIALAEKWNEIQKRAEQ